MIVKGKINSIVIDSCRKSSIVFDSLVSSIEFVNCQSVQMQVSPRNLIELSNRIYSLRQNNTHKYTNIHDTKINALSATKTKRY